MTVREVVILLMTDMENAIGGQCHVAATTTSTAEENVISETSTGKAIDGILDQEALHLEGTVEADHQ
jgi:hypothetical protein